MVLLFPKSAPKSAQQEEVARGSRQARRQAAERASQDGALGLQGVSGLQGLCQKTPKRARAAGDIWRTHRPQHYTPTNGSWKTTSQSPAHPGEGSQ